MGQVGECIPTEVRARLVALGIPETEQGAESLAKLFPSEMNIAAAGLGLVDLARVLLHFVTVGLISISRPKPRRQVTPGWHACQFYRDWEHLLELVAPYIAEGLRNREGCLWVLPEAVPSSAAYDALASHIDDVDGYRASGQLEVLSHPSWYLDASGKLKSFEEISGALLERQDAALRKGFKFLRAAGDSGWVSGTEQSKGFIDYEMKVDAALGATQVAAICTYRSEVTADELVAIVNAHQDALGTR